MTSQSQSPTQRQTQLSFGESPPTAR
jgi:hypothetical protein